MVSFAVIALTIAICVRIGIKKMYEEKDKEKRRKTMSICMVLMFVLAEVFLFATTYNVSHNAVQVAKISASGDYEGEWIYHDKTENSYFLIESDWLNPMKIMHRKYMNTEKVERYLELQEEMNEMDLFE